LPRTFSLTSSHRYLYESSRLILSNGGVEWLLSLRNLTYPEIQTALLTLPGIGPKVADCISLFSLNQIDAIPVDTHIWAITFRDYSSYSPLLQTISNSRKTLTPKIYQEIQRIFKVIFEQYVGWAQSLLFAGELIDFKNLLPKEIQKEMKEYEMNEKEQKKQHLKKKRILMKDQKKRSNMESGEEEREEEEKITSQRRNEVKKRKTL
jgi:N-glycosylase/DNA lyase